MTVQSFGRLRAVPHAAVVDLFHRNEPLPDAPRPLLPLGCGRSYGDVCLNEGGTLLRTLRLDRFIALDRTTGTLRCEAGLLLKDILDLAVPRGFFLPVTPGTRLVTVGGAIANDVHGKNHHVAGSFGRHVIRLEVLRSTGERLVCSRDEHSDLFRATIGGLGLTGLITWAEVRLIPIANPFMVVEQVRFHDLKEYFELNDTAGRDWPYTVAWFDCGGRKGRGIFMRGRHAPDTTGLPPWRDRARRLPVTPPVSLFRPTTVRLINYVYYHRPLATGPRLVPHVPFFYPLDGVLDWNRAYGPRGFYQYQCVLPPASALEALRDLLDILGRRREGSFLAVLKTFGDHEPAGMLSFARPGTTLALDFANRGERTLRLFEELDAVVRAAGGALNPSKDARMPGEMFRRAFPAWEAFRRFRDPGFSSSFWRRVTGES